MHQEISRFHRPATLRLIAASVLLASPEHLLAQWGYGVDIDLGAVRTDNLFLAVEGEEESETIYMVAPVFYVQSEDERLTADLRYAPQALYYTDYEDSGSVFHSIDASMTAALTKDRLFLYASAVNFQTVVAPEQQVPAGNIPITGNRIDSRVWEVRPYWRQKIGAAELLLEAAYFDVKYDNSEFQESNERSGRFELGNIDEQQGFAWEATYNYRRTEYEISPPWDFQRASLSLGYWFNGTTRLFGAGGAETAFDDIFEPNMDSDFWEAGLQYSPNQRLNVEIAAGDRSYGTSYRANLSYQLKRGNVRLNYNEGPANRTETVFDRRPIVNSDNLDYVLDRPGDTDRFVRKRGELYASIDLPKSQFSMRVFSERRENRTTAEGEELQEEDLSGIAVRWEWQAGTKTTFSVGADTALRSQVEVDSRLYRADAELSYRLSERLSLLLTYSRNWQEDDSDGLFDYVENRAGVFLRTSL